MCQRERERERKRESLNSYFLNNDSSGHSGEVVKALQQKIDVDTFGPGLHMLWNPQGREVQGG